MDRRVAGCHVEGSGIRMHIRHLVSMEAMAFVIHSLARESRERLVKEFESFRMHAVIGVEKGNDVG